MRERTVSRSLLFTSTPVLYLKVFSALEAARQPGLAWKAANFSPTRHTPTLSKVRVPPPAQAGAPARLLNARMRGKVTWLMEI